MNKKFRLSVLDITGNVKESNILEDYPTEIRRIKEMGGFNMEMSDAFGNTCVVHYNTNHIVTITIYEVEE